MKAQRVVNTTGKTKVPRKILAYMNLHGTTTEVAVAVLWSSRAKAGVFHLPSNEAASILGITPAYYRRIAPNVVRMMREATGVYVKYAEGRITNVPKPTRTEGGFHKLNVHVERAIKAFGARLLQTLLVLEGCGADRGFGTKASNNRLAKMLGVDKRNVQHRLAEGAAAGVLRTKTTDQQRLICLLAKEISTMCDDGKTVTRLARFDVTRFDEALCTNRHPSVYESSPPCEQIVTPKQGSEGVQSSGITEKSEPPTNRNTLVSTTLDFPPSNEGVQVLTTAPGAPLSEETKIPTLQEAASAAVRSTRTPRSSTSALRAAALAWRAAGEVPADTTPDIVLGEFFLGYEDVHGRPYRGSRHLTAALAAIRHRFNVDGEDPRNLVHVARLVHHEAGNYFRSRKPEDVFGQYWHQAFDAADQAENRLKHRATGKALAKTIEERKSKKDAPVGFGMNFDRKEWS